MKKLNKARAQKYLAKGMPLTKVFKVDYKYIMSLSSDNQVFDNLIEPWADKIRRAYPQKHFQLEVSVAPDAASYVGEYVFIGRMIEVKEEGKDGTISSPGKST